MDITSIASEIKSFLSQKIDYYLPFQYIVEHLEKNDDEYYHNIGAMNGEGSDTKIFALIIKDYRIDILVAVAPELISIKLLYTYNHHWGGSNGYDARFDMRVGEEEFTQVP